MQSECWKVFRSDLPSQFLTWGGLSRNCEPPVPRREWSPLVETVSSLAEVKHCSCRGRSMNLESGDVESWEIPGGRLWLFQPQFPPPCFVPWSSGETRDVRAFPQHCISTNCVPGYSSQRLGRQVPDFCFLTAMPSTSHCLAPYSYIHPGLLKGLRHWGPLGAHASFPWPLLCSLSFCGFRPQLYRKLRIPSWANLLLQV